MKRITKDFETRSMCELKKEGAYKYSMHPTTRPTCFAFKIYGEPKIYFLPFETINRQWRDLPEKFKVLWLRLIYERYEFSAHNSFFERCIYDNILVARYGWPKIDPRKRRCTAAKAAACALPRSLEGAGEALNLLVQKDKRGYAAMMATCKPTKRWNAWNKLQIRVANGERMTEKTRLKSLEPEPPVFLEPEDAPEVWQTLYTYCKIDVKAEEAVDAALPDLIPQEQEVWHFNQMLNWRGLRVDIPTITKIVAMMAEESKTKLKELDQLSMGLVTKPRARASILEFLELEGTVLPNLQAKTVEDNLAGFHLSEDMHRLLEIVKALSLTSTKKYHAMLARASADERIRDTVLYHAASTGRDGGTGINPYNFPRGLIKMDKDRLYATVDNVADLDAEMIRVLYGDSLGVLFSALLRNMLIASPGKELFVADFSTIEVAVLWWLADHRAGIDLLNSGKDIYRQQAAENLGVSYDEVPPDGDDRQLGKAQILGCGFRMSWKRFKESAFSMYRLKLTSRQSVDAVKQYRQTHKPVTELWDAYEQAAIATVETGKTFCAGKCEFSLSKGFLWIKLPSSRSLAYRSPSIAMRVITYTALETDPKTGKDYEVEKSSGERKTIQFLGLDKSRKKLQIEFTHGGVLTENIVQATARDLMMPRLQAFEKAGYEVLLSVYDEGLTEKEKGKGSLEEFLKLMCVPPPWATGLPIKAKGFVGPRYRK